MQEPPIPDLSTIRKLLTDTFSNVATAREQKSLEHIAQEVHHFVSASLDKNLDIVEELKPDELAHLFAEDPEPQELLEMIAFIYLEAAFSHPNALNISSWIAQAGSIVSHLIGLQHTFTDKMQFWLSNPPSIPGNPT